MLQNFWLPGCQNYNCKAALAEAITWQLVENFWLPRDRPNSIWKTALAEARPGRCGEFLITWLAEHYLATGEEFLITWLADLCLEDNSDKVQKPGSWCGKSDNLDGRTLSGRQPDYRPETCSWFLITRLAELYGKKYRQTLDPDSWWIISNYLAGRTLSGRQP